MIRINEIFDFLLDSSCIERYVLFGKKLFLSVVVDFIIFCRANFGLFLFFYTHEIVNFLLLLFESSLIGFFDHHFIERNELIECIDY